MSDVGYVWDEDKMSKVIREHDVNFSQAVQACEALDVMCEDDPQGNPGRFMMLGQTEEGRLLQVVCSDESMPIVRLITAFDANSFWRGEYERRD